jgi:hypothetical protein
MHSYGAAVGNGVRGVSVMEVNNRRLVPMQGTGTSLLAISKNWNLVQGGAPSIETLSLERRVGLTIRPKRPRYILENKERREDGGTGLRWIRI